jgi:hypothetical protein
MVGGSWRRILVAGRPTRELHLIPPESTLTACGRPFGGHLFSDPWPATRCPACLALAEAAAGAASSSK